MPFRNERQRKLCWLLYNKSLKQGLRPTWDCNLWENETKKERKRVNTRKKSRNSRQSRQLKRSVAKFRRNTRNKKR